MGNQYINTAGKTFVPISEIKTIKDRSILVVFMDSKTAWLPKREIDFVPGHVVMPIWLAKKMELVK